MSCLTTNKSEGYKLGKQIIIKVNFWFKSKALVCDFGTYSKNIFIDDCKISRHSLCRNFMRFGKYVYFARRKLGSSVIPSAIPTDGDSHRD